MPDGTIQVAVAGDLEDRIREWRAYLSRRQAIHSVDAEELEDHLRNQVSALAEAGLTDDEAFLVAIKRMGDLDALSLEFAQEYSERLWKQLVVSSGSEEPHGGSGGMEAMVAVGLAIAAALAIKLPEAFGFSLDGPGVSIYPRNLSLLVLPFVAIYFAWKRRLGTKDRCWLAVPYLAAVVLANVYPFSADGLAATELLTALHLPIALWLAVGFAYAGGRWRDPGRRMDFLRFSGEWFIYYSLLALGGGVLMAFTMFVFGAIGLDAGWLLESWILPCGAMGAVVISAWLVEAKQSVIENMAPVLTRLFTPLFVAVLLAFLATLVWTGSGIKVEREVLIGFDLLLVLILGLLLYSLSARDPNARAGVFDALQLLLVISALVVDVLALTAISARISEFGFSPNKVAALGLNLILLVNLGWSAVLYGRFLGGRDTFRALESWQTTYLPVYGVWAWLVVIVFPPLFGFI